MGLEYSKVEHQIYSVQLCLPYKPKKPKNHHEPYYYKLPIWDILVINSLLTHGYNPPWV